MSRRSAGSLLKSIAEGCAPHAGSNGSRAIRTPTTSSGQARHGERPFILFENRQITYGATQGIAIAVNFRGKVGSVGSAVVLRYDVQHDELARAADERYVERGPPRSAFSPAGIRGDRTVRRQPPPPVGAGSPLLEKS